MGTKPLSSNELWSAISGDQFNANLDAGVSLPPMPPSVRPPDAEEAKQDALEARAQDTPTATPAVARNALDKYVLNGRLAEVEAQVIAQRPILGQLALMGQATMFYAAPNTGKTLISIALAIEGIKAGRIDPSHVYYINNDDSTEGVADKLRIVGEYGIKMLAEAFQDFNASDLMAIFRHMIENDEARGVVVILDTATKVVNVMDATRTRAFTKVIRNFILAGGTVVALAHANKNPGPTGKPVYRGTTDIVNDFDCVYLLSQLQAGNNEKVVLFENTKRRGNVAQSAAYAYSTEPGISYPELLASVQAVDEDKVDAFKKLEATVADAEVIAVVAACIEGGINTKMLLADAVAERAGISKRAAIRIIERYTGDDPRMHRWTFSVRERGAKVFVLLASGSHPS